MIFETALVALLSQAPAPVPYLPTAYHMVVAATPSASARSSFSRSSFSRSTSSFSRSTSVKSSPSRISMPSSAPLKAPSIKSTTSSSSTITRVTKQKSPKSSSPSPSFTSRTTTTPTRPAPVVTRETYIERDGGGGLGSNPWFWMYMLDNNRPVQSAPSTQVIVQDTEGKEVKVPEHELVVKKDSHNPIREFFVFLLGGGVATLVVRRFAR